MDLTDRHISLVTYAAFASFWQPVNKRSGGFVNFCLTA